MAGNPRRLTLDATTPQKANTNPSDSQSGQSLIIIPQATTASVILCGSVSDTTSTGARVPTTAPSISLDLGAGESVYLLCSTGTLAVDIFETGV